MTGITGPADVRARLAEIDTIKGDPEVRHLQEDVLMLDVLRSIADGTLHDGISQTAGIVVDAHAAYKGTRWYA